METGVMRPAHHEYLPDGTEDLRHVTVLADDFAGACDTGIVFIGPRGEVWVLSPAAVDRVRIQPRLG